MVYLPPPCLGISQGMKSFRSYSLDRIIKDDKVLCILGDIIDSYNHFSGKGLPIGNLASQYFANHYLSFWIMRYSIISGRDLG
ncbi:MAG: hypothetical protein FD137_2544 [Spirochaetes bacterium]|nr:MAG: hypothetical protein FD137_2544 [Spirochaetota bacterium]